MEYKETEKDNLRKSSHINNKKSYSLGSDCMRRPFGVAAMDITLYLSGKIEGNEDTDNFIPFFPLVIKVFIIDNYSHLNFFYFDIILNRHFQVRKRKFRANI